MHTQSCHIAYPLMMFFNRRIKKIERTNERINSCNLYDREREREGDVYMTYANT